MKFLIKIYKHNIYSIIGTLVFHILLVGVFLVAEITLRGEVRENTLMIEIPVELMEQDKKEIPVASEPVSNDRATDESSVPESTNQPSNRSPGIRDNTSRDKFFDESYQREVEAARQLARDVDMQLNKKAVDINDIRMPVQVTEGMSKEEIKNVIYTGESNIEYQLENRYHLRLPVPVYLARGGGVVVVDISVNREGKVVAAKPRENSSSDVGQMYIYAQTAAQRTVFNPEPAAPAIQTGTIRYTFIPQ